MTSPRKRQSGQSMVEYIVIAAIAVLLVAVPFEGKSSVVAYMLDAIRTAYAKFLGAMSLPQ